MSEKHINSESIRHCMIVHAYYPLGETRVQREAEALLRCGYHVDVICLKDGAEPASAVFKGVQIHRLPVGRHKNKGLAVQLLEYLSFFFLAMLMVIWLHLRRRYRTIQVHNPPDFLIFAAWLPRLLGARLILDLHDLMPEFYMGRFQKDADSFPVRLVRFQENLSCRFAHHVITVSHHWQQNLIERGVPANKISVVMNVADDNIFRPSYSRAPVTRAGEKLNLIYHGSVTYRYGLDLVFQAMVQLRDKAPNITFTVLGGGDYMDALIKLADELMLSDRVTLRHEFRPAEELPGIILQADVGIAPYRNDPFTDGLVPTKLLEYAALGLPAIAARTTAIAQYFDGSLVEFFEPGDVDDLARCLLEIYNDRERLSRLAEKAREFNKNYNWTKIGAEYSALVGALAKA